MGLIASTLPTYFLSRLIASFCVPYYLADPTNRWGEFTHDYLPSWAVIEPGPALTWFFEGLAARLACSLGSVDRTLILVVEPARGTLHGLVVYRSNLA